jgi:hypothetical protein
VDLCDEGGKTGEILKYFRLKDLGSKSYVNLSQRAKTHLHDVVLPSLSDWASIKAKQS